MVRMELKIINLTFAPPPPIICRNPHRCVQVCLGFSFQGWNAAHIHGREWRSQFLCVLCFVYYQLCPIAVSCSVAGDEQWHGEDRLPLANDLGEGLPGKRHLQLLSRHRVARAACGAARGQSVAALRHVLHSALRRWVHSWFSDPAYVMSWKIRKFRTKNSIVKEMKVFTHVTRVTVVDLCPSYKRLVTSRLPELHDSKLPFFHVSNLSVLNFRFEKICSWIRGLRLFRSVWWGRVWTVLDQDRTHSICTRIWAFCITIWTVFSTIFIRQNWSAAWGGV